MTEKNPVRYSNNLPYLLLNDQPIDDHDADLLDRSEIARGIAEAIESSRTITPLVMAVDAGWGMGKSSLLRQIDRELADSPGIVRVHFNAWITDGERALESLIKSVLHKIDDNIVRRWFRTVTRQGPLLGVARATVMIVARFLGGRRLVDDAWNALAGDAQSLHTVRSAIGDLLNDWVDRGNRSGTDRMLVVFIDDLDRCSHDVIIKICEAIKLYLDVPGLMFVISCDQSTLANSAAHATGAPGHEYLEKIIQVAYRVPPPDADQLGALIRGYARQARIESVIDETVVSILIARTGRNPRRIKRIFNSFVLEYRLDLAWQRSPLGSVQLVTAILLQHLYPAFYDLLLNDDSDVDVIGRFLDYAKFVQYELSPPERADPWWSMVRSLSESMGLPKPNSPTELDRLHGHVPTEFRNLARNNTFVALLHGIGGAEVRTVFQAQLLRRPLATEVPRVPETRMSDNLMLDGMRIIRVSDEPQSEGVPRLLESHGAEVTVFTSADESNPVILTVQPDVVISDITRGDDREAGFRQVENLRTAGYQGAIVFYTGFVDPARKARARRLDASITADISTLVGLLFQLRNNVFAAK